MSEPASTKAPRYHDRFYAFICFIGRPVFKLVSRPVVLYPERGAREGGFLLASNHLSPYDVSCLMNTTRRAIDWVSIVELFRIKPVGWFFGGLNAMPLDRSRVDGGTVRQIVERLKAGRVVGIFPEGGLRTPETSVLNGGRMRSGIGRMAQVASVPIVPVVILGAENFRGVLPWLPLRRTRYGVAYGEPIELSTDLEPAEARRDAEERWKQAVCALATELEAHKTW